jgi:aspartyl-tRNA(Asn)/glutamyl-tRNA(Gln) amidotransferase subunit C
LEADIEKVLWYNKLMSQLTIDDIKKLADLAKIEITSEEEQKYLKDINNILQHVSMVTEADTEGVEKVLPFVNYTREDILEPRDFSLDIIFQNVPQKSKDNYVKVAKVLKK